MHYWNSPFIDWQRELPTGWEMWVCHLRSSRNKARISGVREILTLLADFEPVPLLGGVLADQKGIFWIGLRAEDRSRARLLLRYSGYTDQVDVLCPSDDPNAASLEGSQPVIWQGETHWLVPLYREDRAWLRNRAPDRRTFLLKDAQGQVVPVKGYRGDGEALSRRGLPPEDARLLVNLVRPRGLTRFTPPLLDPFAGIGGIVLEALSSGFQAVSLDLDPVVQYGLHALAQRHVLASAGDLPFADRQFAAIATEPPFHEEARPVIVRLLPEIDRVLLSGGKCSVMVVAWQLEILERDAARLGFELVLQERINRKGTAVWITAWQKPE